VVMYDDAIRGRLEAHERMRLHKQGVRLHLAGLLPAGIQAVPAHTRALANMANRFCGEYDDAIGHIVDEAFSGVVEDPERHRETTYETAEWLLSIASRPIAVSLANLSDVLHLAYRLKCLFPNNDLEA